MEELLYASTLTKDANVQMGIYKSFVSLYPQDWRGYNNIAYLQLKQGNINEASSNLEKANTLSSNNGIILNNLGVILHGKRTIKQQNLIMNLLNRLGKTQHINMGILNIVSGDYSTAISNMSSKNCAYNLALAQLLTKILKSIIYS
jgi:Flp pilus assembly protein TadD